MLRSRLYTLLCPRLPNLVLNKVDVPVSMRCPDPKNHVGTITCDIYYYSIREIFLVKMLMKCFMFLFLAGPGVEIDGERAIGVEFIPI